MDKNIVIIVSLMLFIITGLAVLSFGSASITNLNNNASQIKEDRCAEQQEKVLSETVGTDEEAPERLRKAISEDCSDGLEESEQRLEAISALNGEN